ncbi:MAG TPA: hypothetical protein PLX09_07765, partial [Xanthomonadaceae bacterium]|nr:hypothetical protein [Xanthomonadaceae bacterium]
HGRRRRPADGADRQRYGLMPTCEHCKIPMQHGRVGLRGTALGFLALGFSHKNLYFHSRKHPEELVLGNSEDRPAFWCSGCGRTVIEPRARG